MSSEELKNILTGMHSGLVFEEPNEWPTMKIESDLWHDFAKQIRSYEALWFDYLFCLSCVDWKTHLNMVYHLTSTKFRHTIVIKILLDRNNPVIESVTDIWKTADFNEREAYEMFGVQFLHHPDLRKLILPDDWIGFPMRKDYEDPVNMIKL